MSRKRLKIFGYWFFVDKFGITKSDEGVVYFGHSAEDATLLRIFTNKKDGYYVDIGAFHPRVYSNTFLFYKNHGWSGINVDASADTIALFNKEMPKDTNVLAAVGNPRKDRTYWRFAHPARNTFDKEIVKRQGGSNTTKLVGKEIMETRSLASILTEHCPPEKSIDLMNIDGEGLELEVLEANDWRKYRPRVISIEDRAVLTGGLRKSKIYPYLTRLLYELISHVYLTSVYATTEVRKQISERRQF